MTQPIVAIDVMAGAARLAGLAVAAGVVTAAIAAVYRWYAADVVPEGISVLIGLAIVSIYLNTLAALGQVIGGTTGLLDAESALASGAAFIAGAAAAFAGRHIGDRAARQVSAVSSTHAIETDVGRIVKAVGRVIDVTLPPAEEIEDIDGYEPVPEATKEALGGKTLLFPRRLTVAELRDRVIVRLKDDYDVGHVGIELADDGMVEYLAVGSRASGIGPTLAPGTAAIAIRADPPYAATSGDIVQMWTDGDSPKRVTTAEVRGKAGDVVTLALDEAEAEAIDPEHRYRLVTLPAEPRPEREFAALLRAADETMGVATVAEGSEMDGAAIGDLDATVVAVRPAGGTIEAIPKRARTLAAGDTVYAIGRPEVLRRVETATTPAPEAEASS